VPGAQQKEGVGKRFRLIYTNRLKGGGEGEKRYFGQRREGKRPGTLSVVSLKKEKGDCFTQFAKREKEKKRNVRVLYGGGKHEKGGFPQLIISTTGEKREKGRVDSAQLGWESGESASKREVAFGKVADLKNGGKRRQKRTR